MKVQENFVFGETNTEKDFLAKFPTGKVRQLCCIVISHSPSKFYMDGKEIADLDYIEIFVSDRSQPSKPRMERV